MVQIASVVTLKELVLNTKTGIDIYHKADFPTVKHLELTNLMLWYHLISETVYETFKKKS